LLQQNSNITGFFPDRILRSFGGFNVLSFTISAGTGDKPRMDVTASKPLGGSVWTLQVIAMILAFTLVGFSNG
jgi:hypothetical protein